ncbi:MAG TPA: pyruvate, water dikinase regulatory protein [Trueperaceae bacterium]|nr:pyruvate, water dikinase regulatory protein [Trueperaceae bacterium]
MADNHSSETPVHEVAARRVYFVSDHTGVTAEVLGHSLLARFDNLDIDTGTRPFVNTAERAEALVQEFESLAIPPIVFSTITDPELRSIISSRAEVHLDLFEPFMTKLEQVFGRQAASRVGAAHGIRDLARYQARIDAVEFALTTDDGSNTKRYGNSEVIMVGVSRVGKSPTCLYLAMQYGVRASNYPLAEDDFERSGLPAPLAPYRAKLFGLTIDPRRLQDLRAKRSPGTTYASPERCEYEVSKAQRLLRRHNVPFLDVTNVSVEELASQVLLRADLARHR